MERIILCIMAGSALLGGLDRILGNKWGLGERFESGFLLLGPTALSMTGIICLTPLLSGWLGAVAGPVCDALGLDPGMLGGLLAIDMGGYQLAMELAADARVGRFAGIVVAAVFGCTLTFTIPVGMGMLEKEDRPCFARGMLFGLIALPVALLTGGVLCGLTPGRAAGQSLPVIIGSAFLLLGLWKNPERMIRGFAFFARIVQAAATLGLALAAAQYMAGWKLLPGMLPIEEAMAVVASIGVVMLGSLPAAELIQRLLKRPMAWLGHRTGMNSASVAGLMIGAVSVLPAIAMIPRMDRRGKMVNAAFMVCAASALAAHLGFALGVDAELAPALLAAKFAGGTAGAAVALAATRGLKDDAGQR